MAHQQELPDIPIKYIPYEALYEIATVFDSPSVDGQRTLEGLAEKIYELSGYKIKVDHIKVRVCVFTNFQMEKIHVIPQEIFII